MKKNRNYGIFLAIVLLAYLAGAFMIREAHRLPEGTGIYARAAAAEEIMTGRDNDPGTRSELYPGFSLNLNTATAEQFISLPGIGEKLAAAIVEYREENGPFSEVEDITRVSGIGAAKLAAIREYLTVEEEEG